MEFFRDWVFDPFSFSCLFIFVICRYEKTLNVKLTQNSNLKKYFFQNWIFVEYVEIKALFQTEIQKDFIQREYAKPASNKTKQIKLNK